MSTINEPQGLKHFDFESLHASGYHERRGLDLYRDLEIILPYLHFSPALIATHHITCLDIENGPELHAFKPYRPFSMTVSEGVKTYSTDLLEREQKIAAELDKAIKSCSFPVTLIRDYPDICLQQQIEKQEHSILITWFNIYRDQIEMENVLTGRFTMVFELAERLLESGGMIILSHRGEALDNSRAVFIQTIDDMKKQGSKLEYFIFEDRDLGVEYLRHAGQIFIVGRKK